MRQPMMTAGSDDLWGARLHPGSRGPVLTLEGLHVRLSYMRPERPSV
jgi:hypothetical protein